MLIRAFILISLFVCASVAQVSYSSLLKKIQEEDYSGAQSGLEKFVKGRWRSGEQEKAAVLYIENSLRLGKYDEAMLIVWQFLDFFPQSVYKARVETALGILSVLNKDPYAGAETLRRVIAYTKNPVAAARARDLLVRIIYANLLSANELGGLLEKGISEVSVRSAAQWQLGTEMQKAKRYKAAKYWFNEAKKTNAAWKEKADLAIENLNNLGAGTPVILVLAPLSGVHSRLGSYMVQGALLSSENYKSRVAFQILDDRGDPSTALRKIKTALMQDSVLGIIGPLLSASAATVSAYMSVKYPQIPLITPTATDNGIAEMGKNIFQLNVSISLLAKKIADYAFDCLKVNEFAIMAPVGDYGTTMAEAFQLAVERRGGVILVVQNYAEGLPDYQNEFKLLRDRKLTLDTRRHNMSLGTANVDHIVKRDSWMNDSTLVFPALFIPSTNPADAGLMAAQSSFNKLKIQYLLGSSGWYGRELFTNGKKLVENAAFSVGFRTTPEDTAFINFSNRFKSKWQIAPDENRIAGLSYDAMNILLTALSAGGEEPLPNRILEKREYSGVYGKIYLGQNGANIAANIFSIEKGNIVEKRMCEQ